MMSLMLLVFICFSESRTGLIAALLSSLIVIMSESDSIRARILNKRTLCILIPIGLVMLFILYRFKADSANGRLLIWRVCWDMIKEKPLFGWGLNGFTAHYMSYQADYLTRNLDSSFIQLADNVNNPFNEYLLVIVDYGLVGFVALLMLVLRLFCLLLRQTFKQRFLFIGMTLAVMVWSFFSYPFSMPFIWIVVALIVLAAVNFASIKTLVFPIGLSLLSLIGIIISFHYFWLEREWKIISQRSLNGETESVLPDFYRISPHFSNNGKFLYNYGAELHFSKHYQESLIIMEQCATYIDDYDVLMIKGDCYQNLGDTLSAIDCFDQASEMVPSRFSPLYYKMILFKNMGDTLNCIETAKRIVNKKIKITRSKKTQNIIRESNEILNEYCVN